MTFTRAWLNKSRPTIALREVGVVHAALILAVAVMLVYPSYRYPIQRSDSGTSSTYGDTPVGIQIGKYVILAAITLVAIAWAAAYRRQHLPRPTIREIALLSLAAYALGRAAFAWASSGSTVSLDLVGPIATAAPLAVLAGLLFFRTLDPERLAVHCSRLAVAGLIAHTAANTVQIALWKATGRLPALAHEDVSVRFGGLWDDPNSTAAYSAALAIVVASGRIKISPLWTAVIACCAGFNLIVAWSYSGWVFLITGLAAVLLLRSWRSAIALGALVTTVVLGVALVPGSGTRTGSLGTEVTSSATVKAGSLEQRTRFETYIDVPDGAVEAAVGSNTPRAVESSLGNWWTATGLLGIALGLAWLFLTTLAVRGTPDRDWVFALTLAILVASLFIPHLNIFPGAALFTVAVVLVAAYWERVRVVSGTSLRAR